MPGQYCFVCASNEGVFLDVTPDNRTTFGDQVETCLSTKVRSMHDDGAERPIPEHPR